MRVCGTVNAASPARRAAADHAAGAVVGLRPRGAAMAALKKASVALIVGQAKGQTLALRIRIPEYTARRALRAWPLPFPAFVTGTRGRAVLIPRLNTVIPLISAIISQSLSTMTILVKELEMSTCNRHVLFVFAKTRI